MDEIEFQLFKERVSDLCTDLLDLLDSYDSFDINNSGNYFTVFIGKVGSDISPAILEATCNKVISRMQYLHEWNVSYQGDLRIVKQLNLIITLR
jgi:hypothetical protein